MTSNSERYNTINEIRDNLSEVKEKLRTILDLSDNEANVYLILLTNDKITANTLSRITKIQRTRIYEIVRRLKERGLIEIIADNPQRFLAISPRISIDNYLFKRRREIEEEHSKLSNLLPRLQRIWNDQHIELISSRISLISEDYIREIIPQELKIAKRKICLALKDISEETKPKHITFFEPKSFTIGIKNLLQRGVLLHILIGDSINFLENAHPLLLKTLLNGLLEGTIEVRAINIPFPQSFLIVDNERVFLFFLDSNDENYNEALRAKTRSLREFFSIIWEKFWEGAIPISIESVIKSIDSKKL